MTLRTTTHLNFRGEAKNALEFYQTVFGGEMTAVTYQEMGAPHDPTDADHVAWGQVISDCFRVMAYDVPAHLGWNAGENTFFVSVNGTDAHHISELWERLSVGGLVIHPLAPAQWSPLYGMIKDRFGMTWILDVEADQQA